MSSKKKAVKKGRNGKKIPATRTGAGPKSEKFVYIMVYMSPENKAMLEKASLAEGMKASAFVRHSAIKAAAKLLEA